MASKFHELAKAIKGDLQNFDQQADELLARRENIRRRGEATFAKHRERLDGVEAGLSALDEAVADLEGSNSKNGEGSDDMSGSSFQGGERG